VGFVLELPRRRREEHFFLHQGTHFLPFDKNPEIESDRIVITSEETAEEEEEEEEEEEGFLF
jgi:hypothetical protein